MARPRKPTAIQTGKISSIDKLKKRRQEQSVMTKANQLTRPPAELIDEVAAVEWRRVVKELKKIDIVGNLDRANLIGYCNAYSRYVKAVEWFKAHPNCQDPEQLGYYSNQMDRQGKIYSSFGGKMGLDINSRLKLAAVKAQKEEDALEQKFGAI